MSEYKSKAGKKLLKILMFSTYSDARMIYREYIQNACDSINEAVKLKILPKRKDGHINISMDYHNSKITIKDNGTGIPSDIVESTLIDIANSKKDGQTTAGYFGIGRFMGAGFCDKISFTTSYKGEKVKTEVTFDNLLANKIIEDDSDNRTATEVIDAITKTHISEENENEHYFIVTLFNINPAYPVLLDENAIVEYLQEVIPIDYKMPFKNNLIQPHIKSEFIDLYNNTDIFQVSLNDVVDIRKPYRLAVQVNAGEDEIKSLHFFKLNDDDFGLLAWGWYGITEFSGELKEEDINRGIRLRIHNIMIGNANRLNEYFKQPRGNNYFVGEIHIIHKNIIPNTDRSNLAPSPEAACLENKITEYFTNLTQIYRLANDYKNQQKKVTEIEEKILQVQESDTEFEVLKKELENAQSKLQKKTDVSKKGEPEVAQQVIEMIKEKYDIPDHPQSSPVSQPVSQPIPKPKPADPFEPLKGKFPKGEIELIKQIFNSFTDNCPIAQKN